MVRPGIISCHQLVSKLSRSHPLHLACKCRVDYSLCLLILGFVVTLAGQGSTYCLMGRLQRRSIVIIAMALLMLLAALTMYYESIVVFLDALHQHRLLERGHICTQQ